MDLPTYTNIWRIEKRLYKLYDVRLPMPLPINWIAVFAGITIPYILLLIAIGLPFNHNLVWLYVLPPGLLTWLTTRPVLEGKRLPELVESQARYLTEPRTWVRLTPLSEKDQMVLTARVWRSNRPAKQPATAPRPVPVARPALPAAQPGRQVGTLRPEPVLKPTSVFRPEPASRPQPQPQRSRGQERVRVQERSRASAPGQGQGYGPGRRAPALPPSRQFPLQGPVALPPGPATPDRFGRPAHVMPVAVPPAAALLPPSTPAAAPRPAPATPMPIPAPVMLPVPPATPAPVPARARAAAGPTLEVSHDAPRRRRFAAKAKPAEPAQPAPPAQPPAQPPTPPPPVRQAPVAPLTPPSGLAPHWPVPARPLRPVPSPADGAPAAPSAPAPAAPSASVPAAPSAQAPAVSRELAAASSEPAAAEPVVWPSDCAAAPGSFSNWPMTSLLVTWSQVMSGALPGPY